MKKGKRKLKVFILDAEVIVETLTALLWEVRGLEIVGHAHKPHEAVKAVKELKPDVVILDIELEEGKGLGTLSRIKSWKKPPLVIVFTGALNSRYREKCRDLKADLFLNKAKEFKALIKALKDLVGSRNQEDAPGAGEENRH